jgi:hypothetical protein
MRARWEGIQVFIASVLTQTILIGVEGGIPGAMTAGGVGFSL